MNSSLQKLCRAAFVVSATLLIGPGVFAQGPPPSRTPGNHPWGQGKPPEGTYPQATAPSTPAPPPPTTIVTPVGRKTAAGERFYIVASVDQQKAQLLMKQPSEVTVLMKTDDNTKFADSDGKALKLSDFRTGDTVWVTASGDPSAPTATRIRKGQMTVADLHRYYLDYAEVK